MKTAFRIVGVALLYMIAAAHVGSPDTWFEGKAGAYPVTVQIVPAGVVPGVARVLVRIAGDQPERVTVQANRFDATGGAPPPEVARPVEGETGLFAGNLWIMTGGSNSVTVEVAGARGRGSAVVPIVASATRRLEMDVPMGIGLAAMGILLFAGLVTIMGAAVRESTLPPGETVGTGNHRRARNAMLATTVVAAALVFGGWTWWNAEDEGFVDSMFKPLKSQASVRTGPSGAVLHLAIVDSPWVMRGDSAWLSRNRASAWTPLMQDHGKLMHLFLVRNDLSAFAHLHPSSVDSVSFLANLPPLPAGQYRVFADIVHESGFTQTMVSSLNLPTPAAPMSKTPATEVSGVAASAAAPASGASQDDSWLAGPVDKQATTATLAEGIAVTWNRSPGRILAGVPAGLRFTVTDRNGGPAQLEPYMGMAGHSVVARDDGSVFVHLHPVGTISMASQMAFAMREPGDTVRGRLGKRIAAAVMPDMAHDSVTSNIVSFPYAFPKAGNYRVWVQVKHQGTILTAAFHAAVEDGAERAR